MAGRPLTRIENQILGNPRTPAAERERLQAILRAHHAGKAAEAAQKTAEAAQAAAARPGLGIPPTGELDRAAQRSADLQLIGRYGAEVRRVQDPALRERLAAAVERLRTAREAREAVTAAARIGDESRRAASMAENLEAEAAAVKHRAAIDAKQAELAQATEQWRAAPTNSELAGKVRTLTADVEQLVNTQPTK